MSKENNNRLKIAFFTPLKENSKSFYFSNSILPYLKEFADIDIFSDTNNTDTFCDLKVYNYLTSFSHDNKKHYDIFFYQVEDDKSTNFCRVHLALRPGVVLFHDFYLSVVPPQTIITNLLLSQCDNIKRDLGKALFSLSPDPFVIKEGRCITRNNINSIYENNISYIPYPLTLNEYKEKKQNEIIKIVFEGSTHAKSRYHKMIQSLKNIESFKLIWLTNKNEINDAIKILNDNEIKNFKVLENSVKDIQNELQGADIAICLLKKLEYFNTFFITEALKNNVFVISNDSKDNLKIFPNNYIAKVTLGVNESREIEFFIKAYKENKIMLDYKALNENYLMNFSCKNIAFELLTLFNQIKVEIAKFYKDFEIQKERAKKKVFKKAFSKCDDYLMDVREELNLI